MQSYILNKSKDNFVMVEKIHDFSNEITLWDILKKYYGFTPYKFDAPINYVNKIKQKLNLPFLKKTTISNRRLMADINNKHFEVYFDDYNVDLAVNGEMIFSGRRFNNKHFLSLIQ